MQTERPTFEFHPDPIATGSVVESDATCIVCERARGFVYASAPYAEGEYEECICPWCIADGSAARTLDATFVDSEAPEPDQHGAKITRADLETLVYRTPGFVSWQQERWPTHCGRPAAFIGPAGHDELVEAGDDAIAAVRADTGLDQDDPRWERFFKALDAVDGPTAYLFRCVECGAVCGYQDTD